MSAVAAAAAEPYHLVVGDWRDECYAVHGPTGCIACGVQGVAARALVDELNRLAPAWEVPRAELISPKLRDAAGGAK